jgi:SAM-dependent methyltransferase
LERLSEFVSSLKRSHSARLFLVGFLALYFELLVIRYLSTEIRTFAYLKNVPLIASFLGIGIGMILGKKSERLRKGLPGLSTFLFGMIWLCTQAGANHIGLPNNDYGIWNNYSQGGLAGIFSYFTFTGAFLYIVVRFFIPLGGLVGEYLQNDPSPLRAYSLNLFGSFAGIAAFTLISFLGTPPWLWLCIGFVLLMLMLPWSYLNIGLLAFTVVLSAISLRPDIRSGEQFWSPYYHVIVSPGEIPPEASKPASYVVNVNYDYHQTILNLSADFLNRHPNLEPNRTARRAYDLPFQLAPKFSDVLIVGAGTGNDVAAALRNGAKHVDAVEIDRTILQIGRRYHPERPYDSDRVSPYVNDARAFFRQAPRKYDLIVFAYLDSHTMFSSFSSLRLDNFVYTEQSFRDARSLLNPGGSLVLAFASGRTLLSPRIFRTLQAAFGVAPRVFETGNDTDGVIFVEGAAIASARNTNYPEITDWVSGFDFGTATDSWPFLYLPKHRIPWPVWSVLLLFTCAGIVAIRKLIPFAPVQGGWNIHFFLLGAGFLLLETRGVTELSLLFGSTWAVNSIVIAAFLAMALLANLLVMKRPIGYVTAYLGLLLSALLSSVFPYETLNSLPFGIRVLAAGSLAALPVFFSGMVFSQSLLKFTNTNQALGINLIGAIVGGALETSVMIGGTGILGPLAILLYIGSALPLMQGTFRVDDRLGNPTVNVSSASE